MDGDAAWIVDSRTGSEVRHPASPERLRTLQFLDRHRDVGVAASFASDLGLDGGAELAFLRSNGLLWEEGGRVLSLVLARAPKSRPRAAGAEATSVTYDDLVRPVSNVLA